MINVRVFWLQSASCTGRGDLGVIGVPGMTTPGAPTIVAGMTAAVAGISTTVAGLITAVAGMTTTVVGMQHGGPGGSGLVGLTTTVTGMPAPGGQITTAVARPQPQSRTLSLQTGSFTHRPGNTLSNSFEIGVNSPAPTSSTI